MNSMTGFGAATAPLNGATLQASISGVNRKQAEITVTLPRAWADWEPRVRDIIAGSISRGRVCVNISLQPGEKAPGSLTVNQQKMDSLMACLQAMPQPVELGLDGLLRLGIITEETAADLPSETAWQAAEPALKEALQAFLAMRAQEGSNLRRDLLARIDTLRACREQINAQAKGVALRHRDTMLKRLEESGLPLPMDDERIIKEIALFADKCDISEESTRLLSHLDQFARLCDSEEPVGRTLDFLCQEIFRELNTTGSKANDAVLAQLVVTAKTELEKIREQVQNVE